MKTLQILGLGLSLVGCAPGMPYYRAAYQPVYQQGMPVSVFQSAAEYAGNSPYINYRHYIPGGPKSCPYRQASPACDQWDTEVTIADNAEAKQEGIEERRQLAARGYILPAPPSEQYVMEHIGEDLVDTCFKLLTAPFPSNYGPTCSMARGFMH